MTPVGLAMDEKEGGGNDDGAAVNGLLIFIEGNKLSASDHQEAA